jgi:hypothetical protein
MVYRVIFLVSRLEHVSREDFKNKYEERHVPMSLELVGGNLGPLSYTRRYVQNPLSGVPDIDFDVVTELTYRDPPHFQEWSAAMRAGDVGKRIAEDVATFVDVSKTRIAVVDLCE